MSKFKLFELTPKQEELLISILNSDIDRLNLTKLAIATCEDLIAKAIAKAEIRTYRKGVSIQEDNYFRLNIQPNDHETGTMFWAAVVRKLLRDGDVLIVILQDKFYLAESFSETDDVTKPRRFTKITVKCGGKTMELSRSFKSSETIRIRYDSPELRKLLDEVLKIYEEIAGDMAAISKLSNAPKFKLDLDANVSIIDAKTSTKLTADAYTERIQKLMEKDQLSVLRMGRGIDINQIEIKTETRPDDLTDLAKEINYNATRAYHIPITVFEGTVTEKSDADNEFVTYAVQPIVEAINDALNAALVGASDYVRARERVKVSLINHNHRDIVECAANLEKLRGIGFTLDEVFGLVDMEPLGTDFSTSRALTKNFSEEGETEE